MNWLFTVAAGLLVVACAVTGALYMLYQARQIRRVERSYDLVTPRLQYIAGCVGTGTGLIIGAVVVYFLSLNRLVGPVEWIGRAAYFLIAAATGGHVLSLVLAAMHLRREEKQWKRSQGPSAGSLGGRRVQQFLILRRRQDSLKDLVESDNALVDELVDFIGRPLLVARRNITRLPFYGYLGTVCGILLMAEELGRIDEASETFKVLSSMARGLVLAFQTTLVGLLTYLPLRKAADVMVQRLAELEDRWRRWRDIEEMSAK